ncbi:MAG: condensation domain-containing protein [Jatrophihabitans sp.]
MTEPAPVCLLVEFSGGRAGSGPLTFGQRNALDWIRNETDQFSAVMRWRFELPEGVTLADIGQSLSVLLSRHEALRTSYQIGDEPSQRVLGSGELPVAVHELAGTGRDGGDDDEVAERLITGLRQLGIDFTRELPLRVAVATRDGLQVVMVAVYSHLAVDFASIAMIGRQFAELAADPSLRQVGPPVHQPLDQAELERSSHGRRLADSALRYWETHLRAAPQSLYPVPPPAQPASGYLSAFLYSPAAGQALGHIAQRTGVSRQAALLAALCAVLSVRSGVRRCTFVSVSGNRFRLRLRDYIGTLAQDGLVTLALDTAGFDELAVRAKRATLAANTNSTFDSGALWRLIDEIGADRGIAFRRDVTVNDVSAHLEVESELALRDPLELPALRAESTVEWAPSPPFPVLLMCNPFRVRPELHLALTADTTRMARAELAQLLLGVENLLVAAAAGDVPVEKIGELTGIRPVLRDADWGLVDACWVRLSEVRRLLVEATGGRALAVLDRPAGPDGPAELVGYLALPEPSAGHGGASEAGRRVGAGGLDTAEAVHRACLELLRTPGWQCAMTPTRYLLCAGAPSDPDDEAAWRALPRIAAGTGR